MSGYSETYREHQQADLIRAYCPTWIKNGGYGHDIQLEVAEGRRAKEVLRKLQAADALLESARDLMSKGSW